MFAFVVLGCDSYGLSDDRLVIGGFESERDAYQYGVHTLLGSSNANKVDEGYEMDGEIFTDAKTLVETWADSLGATEYFHVVNMIEAPSRV